MNYIHKMIMVYLYVRSSGVENYFLPLDSARGDILLIIPIRKENSNKIINDFKNHILA
ncbi:hypothetical protein KCTC32516_02129 [Polaribacter huanghezhanensis]|nr:hypothetical protein KCTC32516_02129 [Polaribacter huanghezhanensis]